MHVYMRLRRETHREKETERERERKRAVDVIEGERMTEIRSENREARTQSCKDSIRDRAAQEGEGSVSKIASS